MPTLDTAHQSSPRAERRRATPPEQPTPADFPAVADQYRRELTAHCYRMTGSVYDAEDMVQEILIVVHDIRHTYEPGRPLKPWLATIATRRCIDHLRQRMRRGLLD